MKHVVLDPGLHSLAVAQARSHAKLAKSAYTQMPDSPNVADCLSYLVTSSFAVELYFKALMIAGRNGKVTKSHDLFVLYSECPVFLQNHMQQEFNRSVQKGFRPIVVIGIIQSADQPKRPTKRNLDKSYTDFPSAISSISDTFVRARYFFDRINKRDYSYVELPAEPIEAIIFALDDAYEKYLSGAFIGQSYASQRNT